MQLTTVMILEDDDFEDAAKPRSLSNLKPAARGAEMHADLILYGNQLLKNRFGTAGVIGGEARLEIRAAA